MHRRACDFFSYDDPPAPQDPPQLHTPLSPPRSRMNFGHRPSTSSGFIKASTRKSAPVQSTTPRPRTPKTRTRSADESCRSTTSSEGPPLRANTTREYQHKPNRSVTKHNTRTINLASLGPVDKCASTSPEAHTKNATSAPPRIAEADPTQWLGAHKGVSASLRRGVQGKTSLASRNSTSHTTTTMQHTGPSPATSAFRYMQSTQDNGQGSKSLVDRRDSVDTDGRSMISSFLDAYCRSDTDEDAPESFWVDNVSIVCSDETVALGYAVDSPDDGFDHRPDSGSTIVVPDLPPKRQKATNLVIKSPPHREEEPMSLGLPTPQTVPLIKGGRPLPPPPLSRRPTRPLPRPPQPPPYTSPTGPIFSTISDMPSISSYSTPSASSASSSPSSNDSTSLTLVSSSSSIGSITANADKLSHQPNISKRPFLAPLLTISTFSSGLPSPLTPDIPLPPSPMTAKRAQASKLSKVLGEEITPELLCGARGGIPRPPPRSQLPVNGAQSINKRLNCDPHQVTNIPYALTPRDPQLVSTQPRTRAVRPQAIYVHDDTSEDLSHDSGDSAENESLSEFVHSDGDNRHPGIKVEIAVGDELEDQAPLSSASDRKTNSAGTSPSDSLLEEIDDMEEAHIGWALQDVITYKVASRVKRTSRTWVLERNGEKWEEQDYDNVRRALRHL